MKIEVNYNGIKATVEKHNANRTHIKKVKDTVKEMLYEINKLL